MYPASLTPPSLSHSKGHPAIWRRHLRQSYNTCKTESAAQHPAWAFGTKRSGAYPLHPGRHLQRQCEGMAEVDMGHCDLKPALYLTRRLQQNNFPLGEKIRT